MFRSREHSYTWHGGRQLLSHLQGGSLVRDRGPWDSSPTRAPREPVEEPAYTEVKRPGFVVVRGHRRSPMLVDAELGASLGSGSATL